MTATGRARLSLGTLAAILAITASWWSVALWPLSSAAPEWLLRTREVCFGSTPDSLPSLAGWLTLAGQPLGMIALLVVVWGEDLRTGFASLLSTFGGQCIAGATAAGLVLGAGAVLERVRTAGTEPFATGGAESSSALTRIADPAPALRLVDQAGVEVALDSFRGRPVIVTFAFAHCQTVCPLVVANAVTARRQFEDIQPVVLVVTLDPWRDTPSRLPSIARSWGLDGNGHVLSGAPEAVERTLNSWRVPRTRNQQSGDIVHPAITYVVDRDGRIAYVTNGDAGIVAAAVGAL